MGAAPSAKRASERTYEMFESALPSELTNRVLISAVRALKMVPVTPVESSPRPARLRMNSCDIRISAGSSDTCARRAGTKDPSQCAAHEIEVIGSP